MKKISLFLLLAVVSISCKNDKGDVEVPVSPVLNPKANLPIGFYATHGLYDGVGYINLSGKIEYNILMPLLKSGDYSFVSFYKLSGNVLFMQMQNDKFDPSEKNAIYTLTEDILPLDMDLKEEISVYLYFENGKILNKKEAEAIYLVGCSSMTEPKKCGTGILSFSENG